jgi:thymidylate synthase (FAD)
VTVTENRAGSEAGAGPQIEFRSDVTVELVRSSAHDSDVLFAARVSTKGEQSLEDVEADASRSTGLISYLMRDRHGSPFEQNSMTFYVHAPIFVFREHMRHRIASYNEESGRYRELRPVFYVPGPERKLVQEGKPGHYQFVDGTPEQHALVEAETRRVCTEAYAAYQRMLAAGVAREVARIVLPLTIYSSMYVTFNARSLMNFLSLRTRREDSRFPSFPQREIEMVAERMEAEWARLMPLTHAAFEANGRVAP